MEKGNIFFESTYTYIAIDIIIFLVSKINSKDMLAPEVKVVRTPEIVVLIFFVPRGGTPDKLCQQVFSFGLVKIFTNDIIIYATYKYKLCVYMIVRE